MLGRFVELAIPSASPRESLEFYSRLGFRVAPDIGADERGHVVVGDGRVALGLWPHGIHRPTLVFACEDLGRRADTLRESGVCVDALSIAEETFNSLDGQLPDGVGLRLIEAITHSPLSGEPSLIGWFAELAFHRRSIQSSDWQGLGLVAFDLTDDVPPRFAVINDSINLAFYSEPYFGDFWLTFECDDLRAKAATLERLGIAFEYSEKWPGRGSMQITAPEGTRLVLSESA